MTETKNSKMLDEGGKSVVALMAALMAAIFAFQLNASTRGAGGISYP